MMALSQSSNVSTPHWTQLAANALLFQGLWFSAVLGYEALAVVVVLLMVAHGMYMRWLQVRWPALLAIAVFGMCADSVLAYFGGYHFPYTPDYWPLPVWLSCLWLGFVITLPASLAWLLRNLPVAVVTFSVAGTLSYMAGRAFGALEFENPVLLATGLLWAAIGGIASYTLGDRAHRNEA